MRSEYPPDKICRMFAPGDDNKFCIHYITPEADPIGNCKQAKQFLCLYDMYRWYPRMSHSSRMQFAACKFKYYWDKVKGIRLKTEYLPTPIKIGAIWDRFQGGIYKGVIKELDDKFWTNFNNLTTFYALYPVEIAKLSAVIECFMELDFDIDTNCKIQKEFYLLEDDKYLVHGFIDRAYSDYIVESKLGSNPSYYHSLFSIASQVGTYFMADDNYNHVIIEAVKLPALIQNPKKESIDEYKQRCKEHILSNKKDYFPGYDRDKRKFGKTFYRSEFDLDQLKADYMHISDDIKWTIKTDSWYQNFQACYVPSQCTYLDICKLNGNISDEKYEIISIEERGDV